MYFMVHEDIVTFLAEVYYCLVQTQVKMDNFIKQQLRKPYDNREIKEACKWANVLFN